MLRRTLLGIAAAALAATSLGTTVAVARHGADDGASHRRHAPHETRHHGHARHHRHARHHQLRGDDHGGKRHGRGTDDGPGHT